MRKGNRRIVVIILSVIVVCIAISCAKRMIVRSISQVRVHPETEEYITLPKQTDTTYTNTSVKEDIHVVEL